MVTYGKSNQSSLLPQFSESQSSEGDGRGWVKPAHTAGGVYQGEDPQVRKLILSRAAGDLLILPSREPENYTLECKPVCLEMLESLLSWNGSGEGDVVYLCLWVKQICLQTRRDTILASEDDLLCKHPRED